MLGYLRDLGRCCWLARFCVGASVLSSVSLAPLLAQSAGYLPEVAGSDHTSQTPYFNLGSVLSSGSPGQMPYSVDTIVHYSDGHSDDSAYSETGVLYPNGVSAGGTEWDGQLINFEPGKYDTMPSTQVTPTVRTGFYLPALLGLGAAFENHTEGITIAAVFTVDASGKFLPLEGATIHFKRLGEDDQYQQSYAPALRSLGGGKSVYCCFGQQQGAFVPPDKPYPDGFAMFQYYFWATCPGYHTVSSNGNVVSKSGGSPTGYEWVGKGCALIMSPNSSTAPGSATLGQGLDSGTGAITAVTGGGSTGVTGGGSLFNMDAFFARLGAFFFDPATAKPALDALKVSSDRLSSWGPFGIPSQVAAQFTGAAAAFSSVPSTAPDYWVFPSFGGPGVPDQVFSAPSDYNVNAPAATPTYGPGMWDRLSWSALQNNGTKLDLAPYSAFILFGRYFVLLMVWLRFLVELRDKMTPEVKV